MYYVPRYPQAGGSCEYDLGPAILQPPPATSITTEQARLPAQAPPPDNSNSTTGTTLPGTTTITTTPPTIGLSSSPSFSTFGIDYNSNHQSLWQKHSKYDQISCSCWSCTTNTALNTVAWERPPPPLLLPPPPIVQQQQQQQHLLQLPQQPNSTTSSSPQDYLLYPLGSTFSYYNPMSTAIETGTSSGSKDSNSFMGNLQFSEDKAPRPHPPPPPQQHQGSSSSTTSSAAIPNGYGAYTPTHTPRKVRRRKKSPDWNEFYKNGYPTEIIIISDDDEDDDNDQQKQNTTTQKSDSISDSRANSKRRLLQFSSSTTADEDDESYNNQDNEPTRKKQKRQQPEKRRQQPNAPLYVPPSKPIQKSSEVIVKKIYDKTKVSPKTHDDQDGHYVICSNSDFTDRYRISKLLGQGTFGKVVAAYDKISKQHCAIKIIRAVQKYRDASRIELRVLNTLSKYDRDNINKCIHLRECFDYRNHICIVTDLLGMSIYDFMKSNSFMSFPPSHVQNFGLQLFKSVAFLHDLNLIHTDLKPENILLLDSQFDTFATTTTSSRNNNTNKGKKAGSANCTRNVLRNTNIHLIDFGSAIFDDEYHSSVVSTRHYRAPEIILGTGWSFPCDIWSIGCILIELVIGDALFQTHDNLEHLALMEKIIGKIDKHVVKRAFSQNEANAKLLFDSKWQTSTSSVLLYPTKETTANSRRYVEGMSSIENILKPTIDSWGSRNQQFWSLFIDLLRRIFVYDTSKRITAREALNHPWFQVAIRDEGKDAVMAA